MTEHKNIYAALAAAQMQMGRAIKDSANPAFRSKYADLSSVMDACMGALNANGIAVYQPTVDEDGQRYVKTILAHVTGETLECRVPLIVQKNDMQGYGSAVTYARRYGLMGMAGIAPEDDDGNAAAKAAPVTEDRPAKSKADTSKAIGEACAYLAGAADLPDLQARWQNLPTAVKGRGLITPKADGHTQNQGDQGSNGKERSTGVAIHKSTVLGWQAIAGLLLLSQQLRQALPVQPH